MSLIKNIERVNEKVEQRLREKTEPAKPELDVFSMIREDRDFAVVCKYDPAQLHCKGCPNSCAVSQVKCTRGRELQEALEKLACDNN